MREKHGKGQDRKATHERTSGKEVIGNDIRKTIELGFWQGIGRRLGGAVIALVMLGLRHIL